MSRTGNAGENRVAKELEADGWIVGSMRHKYGGGDLIAAKAAGRHSFVRLVEVKANRAGGPFKNFLRGDRAEMRVYAERAGATAWLAFAPPGLPTRMIPSEEWPQ